jgi:hypothetical protein
MNHLSDQVPASTWRLCSAEQVPFFKFEAEDFPVAVLRGGKGLPKGGWADVEPEAQAVISRTVATVTGSGSVAQGGSVSAGQGGVAVKGNVTGGIRLSNRWGERKGWPLVTDHGVGRAAPKLAKNFCPASSKSPSTAKHNVRTRISPIDASSGF